MTLYGHGQWMNKAVREELDIIVVILVHFKFSCAGMWPREVSQGELWGVPRHAAFSKGLWLVTMLVTWSGYWPLIGHYAGHVTWEGRRQTYDGVDTMQMRVSSWWFIMCSMLSLLKTVIFGSVRSSRNANLRSFVWWKFFGFWFFTYITL